MPLDADIRLPLQLQPERPASWAQFPDPLRDVWRERLLRLLEAGEDPNVSILAPSAV
jgi:hypothetical protein